MSNISITLGKDHTAENINFRSDINTLRGIAIIAVVLFHFMPEILPGGFAGVDIFFVISGFLMTSLISKRILQGNFSLPTFYAARFKRIAPTLFVMSTTMLVAFWFWLPTIEYKKFGSYIGYVALFISNIKLNKEAGDYFATTSDENWFLHTWSLSVEWQFYLILPVFIITLVRLLNSKALPVSFIIIGVLSFFLCIHKSNEDNSSAFYLLQYRAWEMLFGGIAFFYSKKMSDLFRRYFALAGYTIITFSLLLLNKDILWPSVLTLLPVLGTMICIMANVQNLSDKLDKNVGWIGLSSYSVYLWHWPVVVFLTYANLKHEVWWALAGIMSSFAFGLISWKYIENPAREVLSKVSNKSIFFVAILSTGFIYISSYLIKNQIIINSPSARIDAIASEANNKNYSEDLKTHISHYGKGEIKAVIVGDSHAVATATALAAAVGSSGSVVGLTYSGCPNLAFGELQGHPGCKEFNEHLISRIAKLNTQAPVFMISRSTHYIENQSVIFDANTKMSYENIFAQAYADMACSIKRRHKVFLVNPVPEMSVNVPRHISHALMTGNKVEDVSISLDTYIKRNKTILNIQASTTQQCGALTLDPTKNLCKDGVCFGSTNLQPYYFDDNHLSETGNKRLIPMFKTALSQ